MSAGEKYILKIPNDSLTFPRKTSSHTFRDRGTSLTWDFQECGELLIWHAITCTSLTTGIAFSLGRKGAFCPDIRIRQNFHCLGGQFTCLDQEISTIRSKCMLPFVVRQEYQRMYQWNFSDPDNYNSAERRPRMSTKVGKTSINVATKLMNPWAIVLSLVGSVYALTADG